MDYHTNFDFSVFMLIYMAVKKVISVLIFFYLIFIVSENLLFLNQLNQW